MIVYTDGIFDLFHRGHIEFLNNIKKKYKNCILIVGIINDKDSTKYKRKPILISILISFFISFNVLFNYKNVFSNKFAVMFHDNTIIMVPLIVLFCIYLINK